MKKLSIEVKLTYHEDKKNWEGRILPSVTGKEMSFWAPNPLEVVHLLNLTMQEYASIMELRIKKEEDKCEE